MEKIMIDVYKVVYPTGKDTYKSLHTADIYKPHQTYTRIEAPFFAYTDIKTAKNLAYHHSVIFKCKAPHVIHVDRIIHTFSFEKLSWQDVIEWWTGKRDDIHTQAVAYGTVVCPEIHLEDKIPFFIGD